MANSLGSLTVSLGLDSASFTQGLSRSEYQAQQFSKSIEDSFTKLGKFIAGLEIGRRMVGFVEDTIAAASALNNLSAATGSSVEALSKLSNQAKISGTSFETLQSALLKLSAGMGGADDQSKRVKEALQVLGVTSKDPATALNDVALALDKYADGANKAALAQALFGRSGPELLSTLKDIAQTQDVLATTTAKQAEEAEKLEKAWRRLSVESTTLKNAVLSDLVPALNSLLEQMTDGIEIFGSFGSALINIGIGIDPFKKALDSIKELNQRITDIQEGKGLEGRTLAALGRSNETLEVLFKRRAYLLLQLGRASAAEDFPDQVSRATGRKPEAPVLPSHKAAAKGVDEFGRALERVNKMAAETSLEYAALEMGVDNLSHAEKALAQLQADDVWQKFTDTQKQQIIAAYDSVAATEKEIDAFKKRREEFNKYIDALQKQAETETKAREHAQKTVEDYTLQNDILKRQIDIIGQDQLAHEKLAAAVEFERRQRELLAAGRIGEAAELEKQYQIRLKLLDAMDAANKALEEQRKQKQFIDDIGRAFGDAAEQAIVFGKSAKDVLKGLEQDLLRLITRKLVTEPLSNAISGFLGALMPAAGGGAGGGIGGLSGSFASGTSYAPGGMAIVGERGPELVNLPRGAQVIPLHGSSSKAVGDQTSIVVNVLPGASRASATQAANEMTRQQLRALRIR